mmetsp:Transcript_22835/g.56729  ORF Transcript_22835/g.56729 Transcript_22835/m.56729 type:complete len:316 (+) Transcript_22835:2-949(+)
MEEVQAAVGSGERWVVVEGLERELVQRRRELWECEYFRPEVEVAAVEELVGSQAFAGSFMAVELPQGALAYFVDHDDGACDSGEGPEHFDPRNDYNAFGTQEIEAGVADHLFDALGLNASDSPDVDRLHVLLNQNGLHPLAETAALLFIHNPSRLTASLLSAVRALRALHRFLRLAPGSALSDTLLQDVWQTLAAAYVLSGCPELWAVPDAAARAEWEFGEAGMREWRTLGELAVERLFGRGRGENAGEDEGDEEEVGLSGDEVDDDAELERKVRRFELQMEGLVTCALEKAEYPHVPYELVADVLVESDLERAI